MAIVKVNTEKLSAEVRAAIEGAIVKPGERAERESKRSRLLKATIAWVEGTSKSQKMSKCQVAGVNAVKAAGANGILGADLEAAMAPENSGHSPENWARFKHEHLYLLVEDCRLSVNGVVPPAKVKKDKSTAATSTDVAAAAAELKDSIE